MNLQQLKYIVALNRFRNFARAAEACQISQPTLSAMLVKLEEELDTRIFERSNKTVSPTASGKKIIRQAETAMQEIDRISEYRNIFITGATGSGKTYMACAFGMEACKHYYTVRYVRLPF